MRTINFFILLLVSSHIAATDLTTSPAVEKLFHTAGVQGTFVLYDVTENRFITHNPTRANTRYIPASTFKIPNSLIGLSVGAVKDVDEPLPYGGKPQPYKSWEEDMGLRNAIKISNIPIYQELARRIGLDRMQHNVAKMNYGNAEIGSKVDYFWLAGPLKISATEQTRFLAELAQGELPFPSEAQQQVREILLLDQAEEWTLYGKTGWADATDPDIGWWVGWVLKGNKVYSFALNIDILSKTDAVKRVELGKASLKVLGVL